MGRKQIFCLKGFQAHQPESNFIGLLASNRRPRVEGPARLVSHVKRRAPRLRLLLSHRLPLCHKWRGQSFLQQGQDDTLSSEAPASAGRGARSMQGRFDSQLRLLACSLRGCLGVFCLGFFLINFTKLSVFVFSETRRCLEWWQKISRMMMK